MLDLDHLHEHGSQNFDEEEVDDIISANQESLPLVTDDGGGRGGDMLFISFEYLSIHDYCFKSLKIGGRRRLNCCGGRGQKVSEPMTEKPKHLLNQWFATAISGNDITSSVLYMGGELSIIKHLQQNFNHLHLLTTYLGLCTALAGPFAPISIIMVCVVVVVALDSYYYLLLKVVLLLYLFRSVYSEVVTALPLNGGAYNALLNTTSKVKKSSKKKLLLLLCSKTPSTSLLV